jgi:hypothetical protein
MIIALPLVACREGSRNAVQNATSRPEFVKEQITRQRRHAPELPEDAKKKVVRALVRRIGG